MTIGEEDEDHPHKESIGVDVHMPPYSIEAPMPRRAPNPLHVFDPVTFPPSFLLHFSPWGCFTHLPRAPPTD